MKWEYKTIKFVKDSFWKGEPGPEEISKQLNAQGQSGWELVSINGGGYSRFHGQGLFAVLKRQG